MRLLFFWCLAIHVVDCWTTYKLASYYGWEGELNTLVRNFISQSWVHLVFLKIVTVSPLLYVYNYLWEETESYDWRHEWAIKIMTIFNIYASGIITNNILTLRLVS